MPYTGISAMGLAASVLVASVRVSSASAWLDCNSRPNNLISLSESSMIDGEWAQGNLVLIEGFIKSVNADDHEFTLTVRHHPCTATPELVSMNMH